MIYLLGYLFVGAIFLTACSIWHTKSRDQEPKSYIDEMDKMARERRSKILNFIYDYILTPIGYVLVICGALILWPLFAYLKIKIWLYPTPPLPENKKFYIELTDLRQELTIEEIEARELVFDPLGAAPNVPFGHLNQKWLEFLASKKPEDRIWQFSTLWGGMLGVKDHFEGYVLVNGENIGAHFFTNWNFIGYSHQLNHSANVQPATTE